MNTLHRLTIFAQTNCFSCICMSLQHCSSMGEDVNKSRKMALKKCLQYNNTSGFEVFRDWSDFHMKGLSYQVCQKVWWCIDDVVEQARKTSWKTAQRGHSHPSRIVFPVKICCRKHKGSHCIACGIENMSSTLRQALFHGIPMARNGLCPSSAIHFNKMSILA